MYTLIVYDSVFGNTKELAEEMGAWLHTKGKVRTVRPQDCRIEEVAIADLLVLASPTRAFQPTPEMTQFCKSLPATAVAGKPVLIWDTRVDVNKVRSGLLTGMARIFGYAAPRMASLMRKKGARVIEEPLGFFVDDKEGPLSSGERARAERWIRNAVQALA